MENSANVQVSQLTEHNLKVPAIFSPNGLLLANAVKKQLQVWNVISKEISLKYFCHTTLDFIKWSPNSKLICCGKLKDSVQICNLEMPEWKCKITGCLGFASIFWAPDNLHLLVISEYYIKVTVFSFVSAVAVITEVDRPKAIETPIIVSPCEKYLVIAQRIKSEDYLTVYSSVSWESIKGFKVETKNLSSITFSPKELVVAVLDSAVEYRVLFYCTDGRIVGKYVVESGFGLVSLNWNHLKNIIAIGDCLNKITVLEALNYESVTSFQNPEVIESLNINIYKVNENSPENMGSQVVASSPFFELDDVIQERPFVLLTSSLEKEKTRNPLKSGVQILEFSSDGKYMAVVDGHFPKVVFFYKVEGFKLQDVVVRSTNIKSICWHPLKPHLIICSSSKVLDVWSPKGCIRYFVAFNTNCDFSIIDSAWSSSGDCILMNSKDHFSILYFGL